MMAVRRLSLNPSNNPLAKEVERYKETAEEVRLIAVSYSLSRQ